MIPEEQVEELLIGVKTPIHLSEAGEEIVEDVVEEKKVVQTRRCQPLLPLGTSTLPTIKCVRQPGQPVTARQV